MDFITAVKTCFKKYFTFAGRARRSEFWWWVLFTFIASFIFGVIDGIFFPPQPPDLSGNPTFAEAFIEGFKSSSTPISSLFSLAIFFPNIAVTARRLHDIGKSGWLQLIWLPPLLLVFIGSIMLATTPDNAVGGLLAIIGGLGALVAVGLLLIWLVSDSEKSDNRFGSSPKYGGQASAFD